MKGLKNKVKKYVEAFLSWDGADRFDKHDELCEYISKNTAFPERIQEWKNILHSETKDITDNIKYPKWFVYLKYDEDISLNRKKTNWLTNYLEVRILEKIKELNNV